MELALNLFWLVLAVASVALWYRSRRRSPSHRHPSLRSFLSLGCVLALLFPVISLTDDLHGEQIALEDSKSPQRILKGLGAGEAPCSFGKFTDIPAHISCPARVAGAGRYVTQVLPSHLPPRGFARTLVSEGRAPPSSQA